MEPDVQEISRNPDGTFPQGVSGNPKGRPKGQSLKEYWRQKFAEMTDEEKEAFTAKVGSDTIWKMAEGNPANATDLTTKGDAISLNVVVYGDHKPALPTESVPNPAE